MKKSDSLQYELSKSEVVALFIYFSLLLVCGGVGSIITLIYIAKAESYVHLILVYTIISSFSVGSMLCSMQYIKRLYKACITNRIVDNGSSMCRIGNLAYFLLRPLYAFAFIIVMIFALLSGMFIVTGNLDYIINDKFLYLCAILSSFIGYSIGNLLDKFEDLSKSKIENIK